MESELTRRRLLQMGLVAAGTALAGNCQFPEISYAQKKPKSETSGIVGISENEEKLLPFVKLHNELGGVGFVGKRLSQVITREGHDGARTDSVVYEKGEFQITGTGSERWGDLLADMAKNGYDPILRNGSLGVNIPPEKRSKIQVSSFEEGLEIYNLRPDVQEKLKELNNKMPIGTPRAYPDNIDGAFETFRTDALAGQFWIKEHEFVLQNVGIAAVEGRFVPPEAVLLKPSDDLELLKLLLPKIFTVEDAIALFSNSTGVSYAKALSIAKCESTLDPTAVNRSSGAAGFWQLLGHNEKFIARGWDPWTGKMDLYQNTIVAIEVYHRQGIYAWSCA